MSIAKTLLTFAGGVVVGAVAKPAIKGVKKLFSKEEKVTEKQETGKKKSQQTRRLLMIKNRQRKNQSKKKRKTEKQPDLGK